MIPESSASARGDTRPILDRPIRLLTGALIDQIAAGEVVERPASVVKELLENALDAGANTIVVEVDGGGIDRITVSDNGHGIREADVSLALARHATSKIATHDDLLALRTFGFRGEALPSIASVAKLTLTSRTHETDYAVRAAVVGGGAVTVSPLGAAPGTTVEVRDLFFNVPARRKFLKSVATENALIAETCLRAALQHPGLHLTLVRNGKRAREFLPAKDLGARAKEAFVAETLMEIAGEQNGVSVVAFLAPPERARQGGKGLHLLLNRRPLRDRALARSVAFAYGSVLPPGRYPVGVAAITVDPASVDVNVHPQKAEVRFSDARTVLDAVTRCLARGLGQTPWRSHPGALPTSEVRSGPAAIMATPGDNSLRRAASFWEDRLRPARSERPSGLSDSRIAHYPTGAAGAEEDGTPAEDRGCDSDSAVRDGSDAQKSWASDVATDTAAVLRQEDARGAKAHGDAVSPDLFGAEATGLFSSFRVVAQVRRMILVCEGPDGLVLIDQHAADERVRYGQLRAAYQDKTVAMQQLLFPERAEVSETEAAFAEESQDALHAMGLDVRRIGATTLAIAAIPTLVKRAAPAALACAALAELSRAGERDFGDAVDTAFATMACHAAVRAGDTLSLPEGQALLLALDRAGDFAGHCPHGRPILMTLPWRDVERRLGR